MRQNTEEKSSTRFSKFLLKIPKSTPYVPGAPVCRENLAIYRVSLAQLFYSKLRERASRFVPSPQQCDLLSKSYETAMILELVDLCKSSFGCLSEQICVYLSWTLSILAAFVAYRSQKMFFLCFCVLNLCVPSCTSCLKKMDKV